MRRLLTYILVIAGLISGGVQAREKSARIGLPADRTIDLGLIDGDSLQTGHITIRNIGEGPLVITRVFADCSCAVPSYPHDPIAPGDSARLSVRYDGRGMRHGPFLKILKLRSNADTPLLHIFVKGTIRRPQKK